MWCQQFILQFECINFQINLSDNNDTCNYFESVTFIAGKEWTKWRNKYWNWWDELLLTVLIYKHPQLNFNGVLKVMLWKHLKMSFRIIKVNHMKGSKLTCRRSFLLQSMLQYNTWHMKSMRGSQAVQIISIWLEIMLE